MFVPVIMISSSGTRLWPLSRKNLPKQSLRLTRESTLFQQAVARTRVLGDAAAPIVVCNEENCFVVAGQLRELKIEGATILQEPMPRNSGKMPLELIEMQFGSYLSEDDIERLEDVYGRDGRA